METSRVVKSAQEKLTKEIKQPFSIEPWGDSKSREQGAGSRHGTTIR